MVTLPPLLTPADVTQRLAADGLSALGLAVPMLSGTWSDSDVTYDEAALTLTATGSVRAPFVGIRTFVAAGAVTRAADVDGTPLLGPATVLTLHPQAHVRLQRLITSALGQAAGAIRPVPASLVVRSVGGTSVQQWLPPGADVVTTGGTASLHDERGLVVDPVAFAGLAVLLATAFPALADAPPSPAPGGVASIAGKASGVLVHVVDPHGALFAAPAGEAPVLVDAGGAPVGAAGGLVTLAAGQGVGPPPGATRLRVGWARNGLLDRVPVVPPAAPGLTREFLRVCAVDLPWHLLGNRTASAVQDVGRDDGTQPAQFHPQVRDRVAVDLLTDGVDVLAAAGQVLSALTPGFTGLVFAASPTLDPGVGLPPAPGPAGHWPTSPPPTGGGGPVTGTAATGLTATWSGPRDVVLTFPGGTVPVDAAVRVYPQAFQVVRSIGPEPSFLRGDGAATVVTGPGPFSLLLEDPLRLDEGVSQPPDSILVLDLVVTDRASRRRTAAAVALPVTSAAPAVAPADPFGAPDLLAPVPPTQLGIGPSPVFGIPRPAAPPGGGPPGSLVELLRRLSDETAPRSAPRLPGMARFPTVVAVGTGPTTAPLAWQAVVSGGRWARETRSALHHLGNPGNPAGPDVDAAGVRVDGALAFDAARVAMRRATALLPLQPGSLGWLQVVGNAGWRAPAEPLSDAPAGPGQPPRTCAAALLRTVAVGAETPELLPDLIPIPAPDASVQNLANDIADALGVPRPTVGVANEAVIRDELREEFHTTRFGRRDALWSLRRAVAQARDLVLIASPQLAATARPTGAPLLAEVDLLQDLADRMAAHTSLRVLVALPVWPDHDPAYGGWVREALAARNAALEALAAVDAERVVAFHPVGFPGRPSALRSTVVVVDDVWALVGTSHWRRRGMTYDEGLDVVTLDRDLDDRGASRRIRAFRRAYGAALLQVPPGDPLDPDAVRLATPAGMFDVAHDLVAQQGLGRVRPFWGGPTDTDVLAQSHAVADPDGTRSDEYLTLFAGLIGETPG